MVYAPLRVAGLVPDDCYEVFQFTSASSGVAATTAEKRKNSADPDKNHAIVRSYVNPG
jgi:hypothetical protein